MTKERIAKFLANYNCGSRREIERLILKNKIRVNGKTILSPLCFVDKNDEILKLMEGLLSANWSLDWSKINVQTLVMNGHSDKMFGIPKDIEELVIKNKSFNYIRIT